MFNIVRMRGIKRVKDESKVERSGCGRYFVVDNSEASSNVKWPPLSPERSTGKFSRALQQQLHSQSQRLRPMDYHHSYCTIIEVQHFVIIMIKV